MIEGFLNEFRADMDQMIDGDSNLRFRFLYTKIYDHDLGIFDGCNEHEIRELLKRKSLQDWVIDTQ